MALVPLMLLLASRTAADPRVSVAQTGSVSSLLASLSKQTGTPLLVSDQRGKEILIVALKDVPLSEAMKRIAWATYGRWEPANGGFRLTRDSGAEKKAERTYVDWQTKEASNAIGVLRDRVEKQRLAPEEDREWVWPSDPERQGNGATATDRALAAALGEVKPGTIVFTRPDSWCVYSDNPTPAQLGFTFGGRSILQAYNSTTARKDGRRAAHAILNIDYRFGEGHAKLELYDAEGIRMDYVRAVFHPDAQHRPTKDQEIADQVPETPVPLSEASKFIVQHKVRSPWLPTDIDMKEVPELVERMRNPEKFEPMGTFATDVWRAAADWKGSNLVANIDDVYMFPYWTVQTPNLRDAFRMAGGYNAEVQPGWVVARPSLASPPWRHRMDRAALGRLARTGRQSALADLKAWSIFAGAMEWMPDGWMVGTYLAYADTSAPRFRDGWTVPRLLGSLTQDQYQALFEGKPLSIANLPEAARIALRQAAIANPEPAYRIGNQPTAVFANGLPERGSLQATLNATSGYFVRWQEGAVTRDTYVSDDRMRTFLTDQQQSQPDFLKGLTLRHHATQSMHLIADSMTEERLDLGTYYGLFEDEGEFTPWTKLPAAVRQRLVSPGNGD